MYDRLTGLVEKLPGSLQKPVLRELKPIRELFLEKRAARIFLIGDSPRSVVEILNGWGVDDIKRGGSDNGWRSYYVEKRGAMTVLDARHDASEEFMKGALARFHPDVVLLIQEREFKDAEWKQIVAHLSTIPAPLIGLASERMLPFRLQAQLAAEATLAHRISRILTITDPTCVEALCSALPLQAQLEFARLTCARQAQAYIAGSLLKSFSAVCGIIGMQPIPLADLPILTTLQTLMIGMIIHVTGQPFSMRMIAEFLAALGLNVGAGFALREGARALIRVLPFWGNAISGLVAGGGTYAIGHAAIAYFIEDKPIQETRKIFHRLLPRFKRKPISAALSKK